MPDINKLLDEFANALGRLSVDVVRGSDESASLKEAKDSKQQIIDYVQGLEEFKKYYKEFIDANTGFKSITELVTKFKSLESELAEIFAFKKMRGGPL